MAMDRHSSKLSVILHADIADSTVLVQRDEHLAHERIKDAFRRFGNTIERYRGHVLELRGDAVLAEFDRASDAVAATLSFQVDHTYFLSRLKDDLRPTVRVGVALGEIIVADNTVTGAGVILAQRVEQLADPGALCITAAVREALPKRMPFDLESLGEQKLQGFDEAVLVYRVELKAGKSAPAPQPVARELSSSIPASLVMAVLIVVILASGAYYWFDLVSFRKDPGDTRTAESQLDERPSLAVLPFTNISDDARQEYFADGMTEDLITDLSKISGLLVIARNSVFVYKNNPQEPRQIAQDLGVRYLLEGSVRRDTDRVRINVQLIDASTGAHIWAERYDENLVDVFALQDKVTRRIVATLRVKLKPDEVGLAGGTETSNVLAYDAFLKGSAKSLKQTPEDSAEAISYFLRALELDPNYTSAIAALAQIYWDYSHNSKFNALVDPPVAGSYPASGYQTHVNAWNFFRQLKSSQGRPSIRAHTLAARMFQRQRRFDEAMAEARRAVELGPNDSGAYDALIENLIYAGEPEQALAWIEKSLPLDPAAPGEKLFLKGMALLTLGRPEDAVIAIDDARRHNRQQSRYAAIQAVALAELGRLREAEIALSDYLSSWSTFADPDLNQAMFYWPFRRIDMQSRLADGFIRAGMPIPRVRNFAATDENRLSSEQIRSLLSDKKMIGGDRGHYNQGGIYVGDHELVVIRDKSLQITSQGNYGYFRAGAASKLQNDLLCDPWHDLGEYCVAIYRNPDGYPAARNEYLFFTLISNFSFSVTEP